jgi:hypothetical protein
MYFVVAVVASVHRYIPQAAAQGSSKSFLKEKLKD